VPSFRNAPETRHLGVEVGSSVLLKEGLFGADDRLSWRMAYTWSRFRFVRDADFDGNFLAGAPRHLTRSELRYSHPSGFWLAPAVDWSPATYFMDSANTARNDKYAVLNLKAGFDRGRWELFVEGGNLTNRRYSASVQVDNALGRFFEPADGRSVYGGIRFRY
jgi:iron complex outermembrane receptor protein